MHLKCVCVCASMFIFAHFKQRNFFAILFYSFSFIVIVAKSDFIFSWPSLLQPALDESFSFYAQCFRLYNHSQNTWYCIWNAMPQAQTPPPPYRPCSFLVLTYNKLKHVYKQSCEYLRSNCGIDNDAFLFNHILIRPVSGFFFCRLCLFYCYYFYFVHHSFAFFSYLLLTMPHT